MLRRLIRLYARQTTRHCLRLNNVRPAAVPPRASISGGHFIPEDVIRRRYDRGRETLIELYLPLCNRWIVYDNSELIPI